MAAESTDTAVAKRHDVRVLTVEGVTNEVVITRAGAAQAHPAYAQQALFPGDRGQTGPRSRATLRMSDLSVLRVSELSQFVIERPPDPGQPSGLFLFRGLLHLFHRDKPDTSRIRSRTAIAAIRGTELVVEVDGATDRLTLTLLEGEADLSNDSGVLSLRSGEQGVAEPGQPPRKTAVIQSRLLVQWCLYYAAVLDANELELTSSEAAALAASLSAYRAGDLPGALTAYPATRTPASAGETVYLAALLLSVGKFDTAMNLLQAHPGVAGSRSAQLSNALRTMAAATLTPAQSPTLGAMSAPASAVTDLTASEWLALSYQRQSRFDIEGALKAARWSAALSPDFGFAWARVAELEFSRGDNAGATHALDKAIALSPRQAHAIALRGFLLTAENRIEAAEELFERAIALDSALGNAWLGRGLARIRRGRVLEGREDLQIAAALEPNRAVLRSYLGKAFHLAGDARHATNELALARQLDPGDPTAWLYSALIEHQERRANAAVADLERSIALNDRRAVYRSRLLLDQDRAVREANLAAIYQDAGLGDVGRREAARAITADYANHSAHLFLANSYARQRDPNLVELRYETAALSEYLLANLLAPAGAGAGVGALSPYLSQQEYSGLFEQTGWGGSAGAEYRSGGDWEERAVHHGNFESSSYAIEAGHVRRNGDRPNHELELFAYSGALKHQLTPRDAVFIQATGAALESGDVRQYLDPRNASAGLRVQERQQPNAYAGFRHDWRPGVRTLLLAARLDDRFRLREPSALIRTLTRRNGVVVDVSLPEESIFDLASSARLLAGSAELQQLVQHGRHTVVAGGRYQAGSVETRARLSYTGIQPDAFPFPNDAQRVDADLRRAGAYGYETWQALDRLWLSGGISFDWLLYPENVDLPPVSARDMEQARWSPKAGAIWTPIEGGQARAAYTRSMGGLYYDQSVRLEPAHVAGFSQAFRSMIPESVGGLVAGTEFTTWNLDYSQRLPSRTYVGLGVERLESEGRRTVGAFERFFGDTALRRSGVSEALHFREQSLVAYLHQLIGHGGSVGARYRLTEARLQSQMRGLWPAPNEPADADRSDKSRLHQVSAAAQYADRRGPFGVIQAGWWWQENWEHRRSIGGDTVWQVDLEVGYRMLRRRAEIGIGLLNIFDHDYRLNPLNLPGDPARRRTVVVRVQVNL